MCSHICTIHFPSTEERIPAWTHNWSSIHFLFTYIFLPEPVHGTTTSSTDWEQMLHWKPNKCVFYSHFESNTFQVNQHQLTLRPIMQSNTRGTCTTSNTPASRTCSRPTKWNRAVEGRRRGRTPANGTVASRLQDTRSNGETGPALTPQLGSGVRGQGLSLSKCFVYPSALYRPHFSRRPPLPRPFSPDVPTSCRCQTPLI